MSCRLPKDKQTGQHRSYGFCEYYDIAAAQHAITHLHDAKVNGKRLKVAAFTQGGAFLAVMLSFNCTCMSTHTISMATPVD